VSGQDSLLALAASIELWAHRKLRFQQLSKRVNALRHDHLCLKLIASFQFLDFVDHVTVLTDGGRLATR
jgi:hypothetical protein